MAIDTVAKRASVPGIARPWSRGLYPDATKAEAWRASVGNTYPPTVSTFKQLAATITASGDVGADLTRTVDISATITASGDVGAELKSVKYVVATITASGDVTADLTRTVAVAATITASGDVVADLTRTVAVAATITASGDISVDLTEVGAISPWFYRTNAVNKVLD